MPTGLTYNTYVNQIATMAVVAPTDPNFLTIIPMMIDYAELRICRDLDLLSTVQTATATLSVGTRQVSFPNFVTIQQINVITPSSVTTPNSGTRVPLLPATKEFLDNVYPSTASAGVPAYMAPLTQSFINQSVPYNNTFLVGPFPDSTYTIEIIGTQRPPTLSSTNTTTFISLNFDDLFVMASMIYISAYQRNFTSASGNDPGMPITYETQYQTLLKSATVEEGRKKFASSGWTSMSPAVAATPTRG